MTPSPRPAERAAVSSQYVYRLQNADILLMDEPTNHLDVMNVKWVKDYIKSLTNVTCIMVSHDSGLLNDVCNHILEIADLKLACFKGNLAAFVKVRPEARAYFELKSNKLKFHFPKPGPIEGADSASSFLQFPNFNMVKTLSSRRRAAATPSRWPSEALRIILRE